jgi:CheY-like chemotaxis protein
MAERREPVTILVAEDDADDRMLIEEAWRENHLANDLRFVADGEELMDYLLARGRFAAPAAAPRPALILLDLNMPKKDGRAALREIKADPALRQIPIVVLTTSEAEEDIVRAYDLGVNSFIVKPVSFDKMVHLMKTLNRYWLEIVELANDGRDRHQESPYDRD